MEKVCKHAKGYYVRRTINPGKVFRFYLSLDGDWQEKLVDRCFFPSRELAQSFLSLRLSLEKWKHEHMKLEFTDFLRTIPEDTSDEDYGSILNTYRRNSLHCPKLS